METARFLFHPHLLETLGRQYRSSEDAVKELVANAWDADATTVTISLPRPLSDDPLIISDNGHGMSRTDLRERFLNLGYDRQEQRGSRTPGGRKVRGNRGIGKLAGLEIAEEMTVTTNWFGQQFRLVLQRDEILSRGTDLNATDILISVEQTPAAGGTVIELSRLRRTLSFPDPGPLTRLLLREFGVPDDFVVIIDGAQVTAEALSGKRESRPMQLASGGSVEFRIWITEKQRPVPEPGIIVRVHGRAIGPPTFFGLETDPEIPASIRNRLYGEINADHLANDVLSNWGGFIENSKGYAELAEAACADLKRQLIGIRQIEGAVAEKEFVEAYREKIERLPLPRRELARSALIRVFSRFYFEAADRMHDVAELVLDAFERDEYWVLVQQIRQTSPTDLTKLTEVLELWGTFEVNGIVTRARRRIEMIDRFDDLSRDATALELRGPHRTIENNLWLLGDQYELLTSNRSLRRLVRDVFGSAYQGGHSRNRPDLFLAGSRNNYVLVEFKRPSESIGWHAVGQAKDYCGKIRPYLPKATRIEVIVIGGDVETDVRTNPDPTVDVTTFTEVALGARERLGWLVQHLSGIEDGEPDITSSSE